jgi:hypothetical protein
LGDSRFGPADPKGLFDAAKLACCCVVWLIAWVPDVDQVQLDPRTPVHRYSCMLAFVSGGELCDVSHAVMNRDRVRI